MEEDEIHRQEQAHLDETYAKLESAHERLSAELEQIRSEAAESMNEMRTAMTFDTAGAAGSEDESSYDAGGTHVENVAELMTYNNTVDSFNRSAAFTETELERNELLLEQPYFAKVKLTFASTGRTRDVYLGSVGAADENQRQYIIDWRSPVAEVYYNQSQGRTSYKANGRVIEVDLLLRRQFDIERDTLKACFDTTVAIEDPLLLHALSKRHSEKLADITATIQKEQNEVVRHDDVEVLLVNGIAGSGKTSVMLQRIAYLLYQERDTLDASQMYLFSPNAVFGSYIDAVLPNMGERNPQIFTWKTFVESQGLSDRGLGLETDVETLHALEAGMEGFKIQPRDVRDLRVDGRVIVKAQQVVGLLGKYADVPTGPCLVDTLTDSLLERLPARAKQLAKDSSIQEEVLSMDVDRQVEVFGRTLELETDEAVLEASREYAEQLCDQVRGQIEDVEWLRVDRIGMRMLGKGDLNALEWLYLYLLITGNTAPRSRFVMIDEVQDYTLPQLMLLERYFYRAHFLLLGDEHQAIFEGTASFEEIRSLFERTRGHVDECRLMTSYRSSPEVTALFTGLLDERERGLVSSVQHAGVKPEIASYLDADVHRNVLRSTVRKAREDYALTAVITSDRGILKWIATYLPEEVQVLHEDEPLPAEGVVLLDLALAKGLEFDCVIIPDAQADAYPDDALSRCRLYTAISRATHKVILLAHGELSPLLAD